MHPVDAGASARHCIRAFQDSGNSAGTGFSADETTSVKAVSRARITRHIALNCCRSRNRLKRSALFCELSFEMEQCIPSPSNAECRLESRLFSEAVNGFLETLSEEKRNIFLRRYWYFDSITDISIRFSLSQSKVKTTLCRTRKQLQKYLEKEGYIL